MKQQIIAVQWVIYNSNISALLKVPINLTIEYNLNSWGSYFILEFAKSVPIHLRSDWKYTGAFL